jgi:DNA-binding IclR family transcriptional regulator
VTGNYGSSDRPASAGLVVVLSIVAVAGRPLSDADIAGRTGLPVSTVRRMTAQLTGWKLLERNIDGDRYGAGTALTWATAGQSGERGVLAELTAGTGAQRARVGVLHDDGASYLQRLADAPSKERFSAVGSAAAYRSAVGQALTAFSPRTTFAAHSASWPLAERKAAARAVAVARLTGVAITRVAPSANRWDVAVPVFGMDPTTAVAAIEVSVPDDGDLDLVVSTLRTAATGLTARSSGQHT